MIRYCVHHNNDIAFLSIVLPLCYVEEWPDVGLHETSMGSVTDLAVGSGAHFYFCSSKVSSGPIVLSDTGLYFFSVYLQSYNKQPSSFWHYSYLLQTLLPA